MTEANDWVRSRIAGEPIIRDGLTEEIEEVSAAITEGREEGTDVKPHQARLDALIREREGVPPEPEPKSRDINQGTLGAGAQAVRPARGGGTEWLKAKLDSAIGRQRSERYR